MQNIPIYKAEADIEGLADTIVSQNSIAYCSQLVSWQPTQNDIHLLERSLSRANIDFGLQDLYPTKSILVSTVWNKNDDVFGKEATWAARHTPVLKPTNIEHDEDQIVGHMTDTWAIDSEGKSISDDTIISDLPDVFHICNSAVIYMTWSKDENKDKVDQLIADIKAGDMFVSMECLFAGFDYAVKSPNDEFYIVARDDDSAFLTKHLRSYGGTGEYDGHKIGRFLKNIVFSGKGYVKKPANPDSVIFENATPFNSSGAARENPFIESNGVYLSYEGVSSQENENSNEEHSNMSIEATLQTQIDELKAALQSANDAKTAAEDKLASANIAQFESQIASLKEQVEKSKQDMEASDAAKADLTTKVEELEAKITELTEANTSLQTKVDEAEAAKVAADRISALVDGGVDKVEAEKHVETFSNLNDEQFTVVANTLISSNSSEVQTEEKSEANEEATDDVTTDEAEANADDSALENAEVVEDDAVATPVAADSEDTELTEARLELQKTIAAQLGHELPSEEEDN